MKIILNANKLMTEKQLHEIYEQIFIKIYTKREMKQKNSVTKNSTKLHSFTTARSSEHDFLWNIAMSLNLISFEFLRAFVCMGMDINIMMAMLYKNF